jgi:hypothetical protein
MSALQSEAAICAANDLAYEALVETCELAGSYARSAAEAAWRGDALTLRVHLTQLRLATIEALRAFKDLGPHPDQGVGPA